MGRFAKHLEGIDPPRTYGKCPYCGGRLVERFNRTTGAQFFGCSRYPECTYTEPGDDQRDDIEDEAWGILPGDPSDYGDRE